MTNKKMDFIQGFSGFIAALMAANAFSSGSILSTILCGALLIFIYKLIKLEKEDYTAQVNARLDAIERSSLEQLEMAKELNKKADDTLTGIKSTVAIRSSGMR